ncbi:hypothetical protein J7E79_26335 [Bacillus sp. ISL-40]|jgi:hypothetical protein|uniref:hypothetical protein n=1 Tax=unclassified Bacillus (in: firmicutes) TaxID=185979 RepID=UPI001BE6E6B4|nr:MULTISPECIES: hypothetical protein [unclassified Bacillus (in: firmicutes)]MBT2700845.1 hypothetical protein [Bacillus sp. ISL-40]MBT2725099.1 hypothetical protein [Bacillus sp. ISL-46]MBT2744391.1 hypothetical protein [Bacillus sp. ISL-77]
MWSIVGIIVIGVIIMFIEVPSLLKKNHRKDLWVFSTLLLLGIVLNISEQLEVSIPNPFEGITAVFQPYSTVISEIFK